VLSDEEKADKKSEDVEEEEEEDDTSCNDFVEGDPLQMICPDSDSDEGKCLSRELEIQLSSQPDEVCSQVGFSNTCAPNEHPLLI
jgi:hypothetical protein